MIIYLIWRVGLQIYFIEPKQTMKQYMEIETGNRGENRDWYQDKL